MNVSIIVPAFNAASTIADTLDTVLAQTHRDWEAIVVDDGSRDATFKISTAFAKRDPRILVVKQENGGEAAARNTGIGAAHFDWLLFLDADDWISPEYLERMLKELIANPDLDAVHCGSARVALDGTLLIERYQPPTGDMFAVWARRSAFPVHACIVRKTLVDAVGRFDTSLRKSADWDLWQRIARMGARFGAVREVLAYYRMRPQGASLEARQMLEDGLRVLRQGHAADHRVAHPHPDHANGLPPNDVPTQAFYLLCWCAGLLLGRNADARPLLRQLSGQSFPELYPDAVAQCIFDAAPLPTAQPPAAWEQLWPSIHDEVNAFLVALEAHAGAPDLARRARDVLTRMSLRHSPTWRTVIDADDATRARNEQLITQQQTTLNEHEELITRQQTTLNEQQDRITQQQTTLTEYQDRIAQQLATNTEQQETIRARHATIEQLEEGRRNAQRLSDEQGQALQTMAARIADLEQARATLERERDEAQQLRDERAQELEERAARISELEILRDDWTDTTARLEQERGDLRVNLERTASAFEALLRSPERRVGDLLLNRLRLRKPAEWAGSFTSAIRQRLTIARLGWSRRLAPRDRHRMVTTVCSNFPIYSHTFVYQELNELARHDFALCLIYSTLDPREQLDSRFDFLWRVKRRLFQSRKMHERDFAHYQVRAPERVEALIAKLCDASGLSRQAVVTHANFLEAFTFTRMVEAYRPEYIHSYFFYDRSLMALVAGHVLDIPRGITCYSDHVLTDYELKVVALHLELCDVVVATSERIKRELLEIAPQADAGRIVVKPNGIDVDRFPVLERCEPAGGEPFRVTAVCRIEPKKGLLDLVEAIGLMRERGIRVEAHLVGVADEWNAASREYKHRLDQRITELGLWGTIHLEGRQDLAGVLRFLGLAHLFVAPFVETDSGDKDGIPTALLEGMATGLATVATDAGSIPEVIENGRDGVLVPQRNPAALADAVEELLRDPERRARLARNAAAIVRERYDSKTCESVFHERIRTVIQSERRRK